MLKSLIIRELLNNLLNFRFVVSFVLCIIITISFVIILTHDYQKELEDYNLRIAMQDDFLNNYAHLNRMGAMASPQKPPELFRPLVIGIPRDANLGSFDDNPLPILFPPIDLIFLVTIIMSLMAILFSYDAIAGEKEKGILRLVISNSISRATILLGKWIGGTISLLIPFTFAIIIGALYITIHPFIQWGASSWAAFIMLFLASVTFISVFYLLGLMVSSFSRFSSTSILTSLLLWVLLILIIPNASPYISAQLYVIPSVNKIEKERNQILGIERDNLGRKMQSEVIDRFQTEYGQIFSEFLSLSQDAVRSRALSDSEFSAMTKAYREEVNQAWTEANRIQGEKARKISKELYTKSAVQTQIAKYLSCISPYANYIYLATDLTGTGMRSMEYFNITVSRFQEINQPYIQRKTEEAREKDPTFNSNSFLDINDRPRFHFKEEDVKNKLTVVLPYWGLLILFNLLFFSIAFTRFMRYDIR